MVEIPGMSPSIDPSKGIRPGGAARTGPTEGGKSFEDYLTTKLEEVNNLQIKAEDAQQQLADGKTDDVTSVGMAGRKAARDVKDARINLEAGDLTWDNRGTPIDGPVVAGMMVVRVSKTVDPVVYFRLESVQLNGQPYKLNLAENDAVLMRIT